tara:strand:+ start:436 stop:768 length:333 start_codon:yes stop_codon:yes gene_type:complete
MKKFFTLLLLSPFVASKEVGYTDYQCGKGFKVFTVRYFDNGILEYEDNVVLRNGLKIKNSEETLYWELSTAPGKKFRFKIDKLNNQAFISGSGYQGKWKKWKSAGDCSQN